MREAEIESYLVKVAKRHGWTAEKFTSPGRRSVPDRIVWHNDAPILFFVECKATGEEPTKAQERDHARRRAAGFLVYVVDSYEKVDALPWGRVVHE
jgi:hypothetical protein